MKQGLNRATLIGNLGADPDLRFTQSGTAVLNLRLATNQRWKDTQSGEYKESTEWHTVVMWGKRGEALSKFLESGMPIYVEGRIQTRDWEDRDGNKRSSTEINASDVLLLGGGKGDGERGRESDRGQRREEPKGERRQVDFPPDDFGDEPFDNNNDIPF